MAAPETPRKTLTRADLSEEVAAVTGMRRREAEDLVAATLEAITGAIASGHRIEIRGFGTFRRHERRPRRARNPKTGEAVEVPARRLGAFKPGKLLLELVAEASGRSGEGGSGG